MGLSARTCVLGAAWGFAEATLFFIVPDVLLTWTSISSAWAALRLAIWVLAGALLGGAAMYMWAAMDASSAIHAVQAVPAISEHLIDSTRAQLSDSGPWGMLLGSVTGRPYKIYAIEAPSLGLSLWTFLLFSIPARLARSIAAIGLMALLRHTVARHWTTRRARGVLIVFWMVFYAAFLNLSPW